MQLVERPEMDDVLRHDDVHAPQRSASAAVGAVLPIGSSSGRPVSAERRGPQPDPADEAHRAQLVQRAQLALAEEQARTKGVRP